MVARWVVRAPAALVVGALVVQVALLIREARTMWFFGDDWAFLLRRSITADPVHALLSPHNEHWSTLPVIAYRLMFTVYGAGSYLPYAILPIAAHVTIVALVFLVLRRTGAHPWAAALAAVVFAYLGGGAGAENLLWPFQISFLGAGALAMIALWCAAHPGRRWATACSVALLLALMAAGIAVPLVAWVCLFVLLQRGLRDALAIGIGPLVVYGVWTLTFGADAATEHAVVWSQVAPGLMSGLASIWGGALLVHAAGPAVLIALATAAVARSLPRAERALIVSGGIAVLFAYLIFAVSRSWMGPDATEASRYAYFGVLMTMPAVAGVLEVVGRRCAAADLSVWGPVVGAGAIVVVAVLIGLTGIREFAAERRAAIDERREILAAARALADDGERWIVQTPDPVYAPEVWMSDLTEGALADVDLGGFSPRDQLTARNMVQVAVGPSAADVAAPPFEPGAPCRTARAGSSRVAVIALVGSDQGGRATVESSAGMIATQVKSGGSLGETHNFEVPKGRPQALVSIVPNLTVRVIATAGTLTVCPG